MFEIEPCKVSIITVCYNSQETIQQCLNSIINQTYSNIEYIIIDGGSKDKTLSIINEYKDKVDHIISGPDRGISHAFNKGIKKAKGEWLIFINSDDYLINNYAIERIVPRLHGDICISRVLYIDEKNRVNVKNKFSITKFKYLIGYAQPGMIFSSKVFDNGKLFSENYNYAMDTELLASSLRDGLQVVDVPSTMTIMALGGLSSLNRKAVVAEGIQIRKEYFGIYYGIIYSALRWVSGFIRK